MPAAAAASASAAPGPLPELVAGTRTATSAPHSPHPAVTDRGRLPPLAARGAAGAAAERHPRDVSAGARWLRGLGAQAAFRHECWKCREKESAARALLRELH